VLDSNSPYSLSRSGDCGAILNKLQDKFEIFGEISRGGMGVVYHARDRQLDREVAIKLIIGSRDLIDILRFKKEAQLLAQLEHPNVVRVWDFAWQGLLPFLVMEYVKGETLEDIVRDHLRLHGTAPEPLRMARYLRSLAQALTFCHEHGIVHRDLKPANVIISKMDDGQERLVLLDFGVAKKDQPLGPDSRSLALTKTGEILGTPAYMAPEQFMPNSEYGAIGLASDVWGFGATAFYLLTGSPPYPQGASPLSIAEAIVSGGPRRAQTLNLAVPPWLDLLCAACLRRSADKRPEMHELVWQLNRQLNGPESATAAESLSDSIFDSQLSDRELVSKRPRALWLMLIALLVLAPLVVFFVQDRNRSQAAKQQEQTAALIKALSKAVHKMTLDLSHGKSLSLHRAQKLRQKLLSLELDEDQPQIRRALASLKFMEVERALQEGQLDKASKSFAKARALVKDLTGAYKHSLLLEGLLASLDPRSDAKAAYQSLVNAGAEASGREDVLVAMVKIQIRCGKVKDASRLLGQFDAAKQRHPALWFAVYAALKNRVELFKLVEAHGATVALDSNVEEAFVTSIAMLLERDRVSSALRQATLLLDRNPNSSQRSAVLQIFSQWVKRCLRAKTKWAVRAFGKGRLSQCLKICDFLSGNYGQSVSDALWICLGDVISFLLAPASQFNAHVEIEKLGYHLVRWRPRSQRSWVVYTKVAHHCMPYLARSRREEITGTYKQALNSCKTTVERSLIRKCYLGFFQRASLFNRALKLIPPPSAELRQQNAELAVGELSARASIWISIARSKRETRKFAYRAAIKLFSEILLVNPALKEHSDVLLLRGNLYFHLGDRERALDDYYSFANKISLSRNLVLWSKLTSYVLLALEGQSLGPLDKLSDLLKKRLEQRGASVGRKLRSYLTFMAAYKAWRLDQRAACGRLLGDLAATLGHKEKLLCKTLQTLCARPKANKAALEQHFRDLGERLHLN
jgi:serine/threonine protein kinase